MLQQLPKDILNLILSLLNFRDLVACSSVSKFLCSLANEDALWKNHVVAVFGSGRELQTAWKQEFMNSFLFSINPQLKFSLIELSNYNRTAFLPEKKWGTCLFLHPLRLHLRTKIEIHVDLCSKTDGNVGLGIIG